MHNLPLRGMNRRMGENIGGSIGRVIKVDANEGDVAWEKCLRVRVEFDLQQEA